MECLDSFVTRSVVVAKGVEPPTKGTENSSTKAWPSFLPIGELSQRDLRTRRIIIHSSYRLRIVLGFVSRSTPVVIYHAFLGVSCVLLVRTVSLWLLRRPRRYAAENLWQEPHQSRSRNFRGTFDGVANLPPAKSVFLVRFIGEGSDGRRAVLFRFASRNWNVFVPFSFSFSLRVSTFTARVILKQKDTHSITANERINKSTDGRTM